MSHANAMETKEESKKRKARERVAAWRLANPDRRTAYQVEYNSRNRERILERKRAHYAANREEIRAKQTVWRASHPEAVKKAKQAEYRANRDDYMRRAYERRIRKRMAEGSHTSEEWASRLDALGYACFYCGEPERLTREHMVPLSRGGSDYIENVVPACAPCNAKKGTRTSSEYLALLYEGMAT